MVTTNLMDLPIVGVVGSILFDRDILLEGDILFVGNMLLELVTHC